MNDMIEFWLKKEECTGCGVCSNICTKNAIEMVNDSCGFLYPSIGKNCIDCNMCKNVCKEKEKYIFNHYNNPITYAVWSKDEKIRYHSTSGGAFSELAKVVLDNNGYVSGACYNSDNLVEHTIISNIGNLEQIRQSKYVQSDTKGIYIKISKLIKTGKQIVFCGAPCQVAALYAFLGNKEYSNLITFDFICRGVNSPKAYKCWLEEIEKQEGSKIVKVWFKYKEGGWKSSPRRTRIDFEDGHFIIKEQKQNLFMHGYLTSNLYMRPSCGECKFKGVPRKSDITLADFWGIDSSLDDDKGTSLLLINSDKGKAIFELAKKNMNYFERNFLEIFKENTCFNNSVKINENSELFLKKLENKPFSKALKKYTHISSYKKMIIKVKRLLAIINNKIKLI